jgi:hypothetical protein
MKLLTKYPKVFVLACTIAVIAASVGGAWHPSYGGPGR